MLRQIGIISCFCLPCLVIVSSLTFDSIQRNNLQRLEEALLEGYAQFCESQIDPGIMSLYGGGDPQDARVEFIGRAGNATGSLRDIYKIFRGDFDYSRKTIIYINGFYSPHKDMLQTIRNIPKCSSYNMLILNFANNLQMLYNTAVYNIPIYAYAVFKVLQILLGNSAFQHRITLVGHSQGAYIASEAAKLFSEQHAGKLPLLVILDPAIPCYPAAHYINSEVADQVLVIHTSHGRLGLKDVLGTIDYYPNDFDELKPGCKDAICSHEKAVQIFAESVCIPGSFMAIQCEDGNAFQDGTCNKDEMLAIGLSMPEESRGKFYSLTKRLAPYGLGFMGISPIRLTGV